jgi:acetoin utilization protein AcuB
MIVAMWMSRALVTLPSDASLADAAIEMGRRRIRHVLVCAGEGAGARLVGILTARDIARGFPRDVNPWSPAAADARDLPPLAEVMTRKLRTVVPETPIVEAARLLRAHKIDALPVVRGARPVGIVTASDICQALIEVVGADEPGVRVTFGLGEDESALATVSALGRRFALELASVLSMRHAEAGQGRVTRLGVVRFAGGDCEGAIDALWRTGHRVWAVERDVGEEPAAVDDPVAPETGR